MSSGDGEYLETFDPTGNVLRFWYERWHCQATTKDNENTENTKDSAARAMDRFERFLSTQTNSQSDDCHWSEIDKTSISYDNIIPPRDVTPQLAEKFLLALQRTYSAHTQQNTYSNLKQGFEWCEASVKSVEEDPFAAVEKKHKDRNNDWILDTPEERDAYILPTPEARKVVRSWDHPMWLSIQLILAKYGRRVGGISNLDFENINLNHPGCDWTVHSDLRQWPDHISFRSDKRQSDTDRKSGNKTQTDGTYPIDSELKDTLLWYLAIRPQPTSPNDPLFLSQSEGERLSGDSISNIFRQRAKQLGYWYGSHDDDNLNPHYWRHWSTSHYQSQFSVPDSDGYTALTQYLRGDADDAIIGIYDNYTETKRDTILDAMPVFLKPYIDD